MVSAKKRSPTSWRETAAERSVIVQKDTERYRQSIKKLEANQARLVQLSYYGLVSDEVLAKEQQRLESEKHQSQQMLEAVEVQALDVESALETALAKTKTPHATYLASDPLERRLLNQAFFKRILVGEEGQVLGTSLTPVYAALSSWEPQLGLPSGKASWGRRSANPGPAASGQGLHVLPMVERAVRCANPVAVKAPSLSAT
ncbi:MAG TPA: hypothetical protein VL988_07460 [Solirubrobacteraceae bacterium]|nr:hypothetical protein [Solirubrobacteraceae bacterium]